jgi:hypothetical protein
MLAGLSGHRTRTLRGCLESVCIVVQNLNALILQVTQARLPYYVALPFAHALMITEAVSHSRRFCGRPGQHATHRIMRWAETLTCRAARDSLAHVLTEA